jgi:anti-anti-sigma factor
MNLNVTAREKRPGIFVLSPEGYLDTTTYPIMDKEVNSVLDKSPTVVILDMSGVEYISSLGVGIILRTKKLLKERGGKLFMVNPRPKIRKIFEVIYTSPDQEIFTSMEELEKRQTW